MNCSNMRFWSNFNCSNGPNVHFRIFWKCTKIAFWHLIIIFEDKTKWIKNVFSKQLLHVFWKPWNTFRDQIIRFCVVVKNKFWKTWLFHFVQIDSKWEEEMTQEDHNSGSEENWEKYWNFWKFPKFCGGPLYLFPPLFFKVIELNSKGQITQGSTANDIANHWIANHWIPNHWIANHWIAWNRPQISRAVWISFQVEPPGSLPGNWNF